MVNRGPIGRPTTAVGLAQLAVLVTLVSGIAALWHRLSCAASPVLPVCSRPIEVDGAERSRLGCADDPVWRDCTLAIGDRVTEGGCTREPGGMTAAMRLTAGVPLDLNRASAVDFELLPGIGPRLAEAIVADRRAHGRYVRIEELERVPGIGPRTVERLRPWLAIAPGDSTIDDLPRRPRADSLEPIP